MRPVRRRRLQRRLHADIRWFCEITTFPPKEALREILGEAIDECLAVADGVRVIFLEAGVRLCPPRPRPILFWRQVVRRAQSGGCDVLPHPVTSQRHLLPIGAAGARSAWRLLPAEMMRIYCWLAVLPAGAQIRVHTR